MGDGAGGGVTTSKTTAPVIQEYWKQGYRWRRRDVDPGRRTRIEGMWDTLPALAFVRTLKEGKLNGDCRQASNIIPPLSDCKSFDIVERARATIRVKDIDVTLQVTSRSMGKRRTDDAKNFPITEVRNMFHLETFPLTIAEWSNGGYAKKSCSLTRFKTLQEAEACLRSDAPFDHQAEVRYGDFVPEIDGDEIVVAKRVFKDGKMQLDIIGLYVFHWQAVPFAL